MPTKTLALLGLACLAVSLLLSAPPPQPRPALTMLLVIDGLRPDSITPTIMPNLDRMRKTGVWYTHSHSVFPTVTRVNTASISTGTLPSVHGIVSNALFLPAASDKLLDDGDYQTLLTLAKLNGGRVVGPKSLGEYFDEAGIRFVALSSGSTGNALLLNPTAPFSKLVLINLGFEDGERVAYPDELNNTLLSRYGKAPAHSGSASVVWTERVLREYVLDTLHPQVIVDWIGQPDAAQHQTGVSSPESLESLRLVDQQIGLLQDKLKQMGLEGKTDIIVTCDHGFDYEPGAELLAPIAQAGVMPDEVVVDNEGGTSLIYIKDHPADKIARLAAKFQASETTNAIFVAAKRPANGILRCSPGAEKGFAPGTFALELVNDCFPTHGPDMIVTWHWDGALNPFGVAGTQLVPERPGWSQPGGKTFSGHGALSPYTTHSTLLALGPDFGQAKTIDLPAGNLDIPGTLLALEGLPVPAALQGRVLSEAFQTNRPGARPAKPSSKRFEASAGSYCAELEVSYVGKEAYLNLARRCGGKK